MSSYILRIIQTIDETQLEGRIISYVIADDSLEKIDWVVEENFFREENPISAAANIPSMEPAIKNRTRQATIPAPAA